MNKIIGIIALSLVLGACGESAVESAPKAEPQKELSKEEAKMDETINKIDQVEKDIETKEENLNKALKELEGL